MSDYFYFLAHASPDKARAIELRGLLVPELAVFLDCIDLQAGTDWDVELPRHQRQSRATIVLISPAAEHAYYLREEIAAAIAYQRRDPSQHRLIAVYLDGFPSDPGKTLYGLRIAHSLDATTLGLPGVAAELKRIATGLGEVDRPVDQPPRVEPVDRITLFDALCRLLPTQFETALFRCQAPRHDIAPHTEPLARRALDLIQWAEQTGSTGLDRLAAAIRATAPGVLG